MEGPLKLFLGHMLFDLFWVLLYNTGKGNDVGFLIHHTAIIVVWTLLLTKGFGHAFALVAMCCEATQPFIGAKWFMDQYGMQAHPVFAINGLIVFFGWWVLRLGGYTSFLGYKWAINFGAVTSREWPTLVCWVAGAVLQVWWGWAVSVAVFEGVSAVIFPPKKKGKAA